MASYSDKTKTRVAQLAKQLYEKQSSQAKQKSTAGSGSLGTIYKRVKNYDVNTSASAEKAAQLRQKLAQQALVRQQQTKARQQAVEDEEVAQAEWEMTRNRLARQQRFSEQAEELKAQQEQKERDAAARAERDEADRILRENQGAIQRGVTADALARLNAGALGGQTEATRQTSPFGAGVVEGLAWGLAGGRPEETQAAGTTAMTPEEIQRQSVGSQAALRATQDALAYNRYMKETPEKEREKAAFQQQLSGYTYQSLRDTIESGWLSAEQQKWAEEVALQKAGPEEAEAMAAKLTAQADELEQARMADYQGSKGWKYKLLGDQLQDWDERLQMEQNLRQQAERYTDRAWFATKERAYGEIPQEADFESGSMMVTNRNYNPEYRTVMGLVSTQDVENALGGQILNGQEGENWESARTALELRKYMTVEEKKIYSYLYNTISPEAAHDYLDYVTFAADERRMDALNEKIGSWLKAEDRNKTVKTLRNLGAYAGAVGGSMASGIGALGATVQKLVDPKRPVNWNDPLFAPSEFTNTVRKQQADALQQSWLKWGYNLSTSMADSTAVIGLTMLGMPAATLLLGGAAAARGMQEAKDRGATDSQAITIGLLEGAAEAGFEYLSLDKLLSMPVAKWGEAGFWQALTKGVAMQSGIEGSEELFTGIANTISQALVLGDLSDYEMRVKEYERLGLNENEARKKAGTDWFHETLMETLAGAVSGALFAGGTMAFNTTIDARNTRQEKLAEEYVKNAGRYADITTYAVAKHIAESDAYSEQTHERAEALMTKIYDAMYAEESERPEYAVTPDEAARLIEAAERENPGFKDGTLPQIVRQEIDEQKARIEAREAAQQAEPEATVPAQTETVPVKNAEAVPSTEAQTEAAPVTEAVPETETQTETQDTDEILRRAMERTEAARRAELGDLYTQADSTYNEDQAEAVPAPEENEYFRTTDEIVQRAQERGAQRIAEQRMNATVDNQTAAQTTEEVADYGNRQAESGIRADSEYRDAGRNAEDSARAGRGSENASVQQRIEQRQNGRRRGRTYFSAQAAARLADSRTLQITPVSSESLVGRKGSSEATVKLLPDSYVDTQEDLRALREDSQQYGISVHPYMGTLQLKVLDRYGNPVRASAYSVGSDLYVAAGNPRVPAAMSYDHDKIHNLLRQSPAVRDSVLDWMDRTFTDEEFGELFDTYFDRYEAVGDLDSMSDDQAKRYVLEEILGDAFAGKDTFRTGIARYTDAMRAAVDEALNARPVSINPAQSEGMPAGMTEDSIRSAVRDVMREAGLIAQETVRQQAEQTRTETEIPDANTDFTDGRYSVMGPYRRGTAAEQEWYAGLDEDARETYDLFNSIKDFGEAHPAEMEVGSGKNTHVKAVDITRQFMTAAAWNEHVDSGADFAETARGLYEILPQEIRDAAGMLPDGHVVENAMEREFHMERSFAQRIVDSLPMEKVSGTTQINGRDVRVSERDTMEVTGGESYRRALVEERRRLYREGKLGTKTISGLSKDTYGTMGFLAENTKTGASGDFTTICPQMFYNKGCMYCYRVAALRSGVNNKLTGFSVWYTGEILQLTQDDINALNKKGGLRIQSFGDWQGQYAYQLADLLADAEERGLQVKIISKEPSMIRTVALLREQGLGRNLYMNLSSDYIMERAGTNTKAWMALNPARPMARTEEGTFWKRAMAVEEAAEYRKKYPFVNVRIVATNVAEFIRGLQDPNVQVVTGYHGDIRYMERVDSDTGEYFPGQEEAQQRWEEAGNRGKAPYNVQPLGDNGMPRFLQLPSGQWITEYEGKTQVHKELAAAIVEAGLQQEYYQKSCCITGRCATCNGKCGQMANDFLMKNATNADNPSVKYWQENSIYEFNDEYQKARAENLGEEYDDVADDENGQRLAESLDRVEAEEAVAEREGITAEDVAEEADSGRYSIEEANDEYMDAVESGDTAAQERMVREAAEAAMPDSQIRDSNGNLETVYHGTDADFWTFDTSVRGGEHGLAEGFGIYLSTNQDVTRAYGERQMGMFADIKRPATSYQKTITASELTALIRQTCEQEAARLVEEDGYESRQAALRDTWISNYVNTYENPSMEAAYRETARSILRMNDNDMDVVQEVMAGMAIRDSDTAMRFYHEALTPVTGIDGFRTQWTNHETGEASDIILAFDSAQLKSADSVTYDDDGNVIPLTERFNENERDIRYALEDETDPIYFDADGRYGLFEDIDAREQANLDFMDQWRRENMKVIPADRNAPADETGRTWGEYQDQLDSLDQWEQDQLTSRADRLAERARPVSDELLSEYGSEQAEEARAAMDSLLRETEAQELLSRQARQILDDAENGDIPEGTLSQEEIEDLQRQARLAKAARTVQEGSRQELSVDEWVAQKEAEAAEIRRKATEILPRGDFTGGPAMQKLGIKVAGNFASYENIDNWVKQVRANESMLKAIDKQIRQLRKNVSDQQWSDEMHYAEQVVDGIRTIDEVPDSMDMDRVEALSDYMTARKAARTDILATAKNIISKRNMKRASLLKLNMSQTYRVPYLLFDQAQADKVYETYFKTARENGAEMIRFINRESDGIRQLKDSKGKKHTANAAENQLIQMLIETGTVEQDLAQLRQDEADAIRREGDYLRENGHWSWQDESLADRSFTNETLEGETPEQEAARRAETGRTLTDYQMELARRYADGQQLQKALTEGEYAIGHILYDVDATYIRNAAAYLTERYAAYYDAINEFLVAHGEKPIGFIKNYAPHLQPDSVKTALSALQEFIGAPGDISGLPAEFAGLTHTWKPNRKWNPHFLSRTHGQQVEYDALGGFNDYLRYIGELFYHMDDIMRLRKASTYLRQQYVTEENQERIREAMDQAKSDDYHGKLSYLAARPNETGVRWSDSLTAAEIDRRLDEYIEKVAADSANGQAVMPGFVQWLDDYTNRLAGKQTALDRGWEALAGRTDALAGQKGVRGAFGRVFNMRNFSWLVDRAIGGNVTASLSSMMNQTSQIGDLLGEVAPQHIARAVNDMVLHHNDMKLFQGESDFLTQRKGSKKLNKSFSEKFGDALSKPAKLMDYSLAQLIARSSYYQGLSRGMTHEQALEYANRMGEQIQSSRAKESVAAVYASKNPVNRLLFAFTNEAMNSFEHRLHDIPQRFRNTWNSGQKAKAAGELARYLLTAMLVAFGWNRIMDEVYGGTPVTGDVLGLTGEFIAAGYGYTLNDGLRKIIGDALGIDMGNQGELYDTLREKNFENGFDWKAGMKGVAYNATRQIPMASNIAGAVGFQNPFTDSTDSNVLGSAINGTTNDAQAAINYFGNGDPVAGINSILSTISQTGIIPGVGRQFRKTTTGALAAARGGSYNASGKLQYPIDSDVRSVATSVLFGKNATQDAQRYFAAGAGPLNNNGTQIYSDLVAYGMRPTDAYKLVLDNDGATNKEMETYNNLVNGGTEPARAYDMILGNRKEKDSSSSSSTSPEKTDVYTVLTQAGYSAEKAYTFAWEYGDIQGEKGKERSKLLNQTKWVRNNHFPDDAAEQILTEANKTMAEKWVSSGAKAAGVSMADWSLGYAYAGQLKKSEGGEEELYTYLVNRKVSKKDAETILKCYQW